MKTRPILIAGTIAVTFAVLAIGQFSPFVHAGGPPTPTCFGMIATVTANPITGSFVGTDGDDVIIGTDENDRIFAGDGNDKICALDGNDFIVAGDGNDLVRPGDGADNVRTGDGNDVVSTFDDGDVDKINCGADADFVNVSDELNLEDAIKSNCESIGDM